MSLVFKAFDVKRVAFFLMQVSRRRIILKLIKVDREILKTSLKTTNIENY